MKIWGASARHTRLLPAAAALSLLLTAAWAAPDAGAATPTCDGKTATIIATEEETFGTDGPDVIVATDASRLIDGGGGNDAICARSEPRSGVRLFGGAGNDVVRGGPGKERLDGGLGRDRVNGGGGRDIAVFASDHGVKVDLAAGTAQTASGSETLTRIAVVIGTPGNDVLLGHGGADSLYAGDGDDILRGRSGNDALYGKNGSDRVYGGAGSDSLHGYADSHIEPSSDSDDVLVGGDGADAFVARLDAGPGASYDGGAGRDFLYVWGGADATIDIGMKVLSANGSQWPMVGIEGASGGSGDDSIRGGNGPNNIVVGAGADQVNARGGNDRVTFDANHLAEDMTLKGGPGRDELRTTGDMIYDVDLRAGTMFVDGVADDPDHAGLSHVIPGFEDFHGDNAYASAVRGTAGPNTLTTQGNVVASGRGGNDVLKGSRVAKGGTGYDRCINVEERHSCESRS